MFELEFTYKNNTYLIKDSWVDGYVDLFIYNTYMEIWEFVGAPGKYKILPAHEALLYSLLRSNYINIIKYIMEFRNEQSDYKFNYA